MRGCLSPPSSNIQPCSQKVPDLNLPRERERDSERQRQRDRSARLQSRAVCSAENLFKGQQMLPALLISHRVCLIQLTLARALTLSPPCHSAMVEALTADSFSEGPQQDAAVSAQGSHLLFHICLMASGFPLFPSPLPHFPQHLDSCLRGLWGDSD